MPELTLVPSLTHIMNSTFLHSMLLLVLKVRKIILLSLTGAEIMKNSGAGAGAGAETEAMAKPAITMSRYIVAVAYNFLDHITFFLALNSSNFILLT